MSVEVVVELPEDVFSALRRTPEGFVSEMRLAAKEGRFDWSLVFSLLLSLRRTLTPGARGTEQRSSTPANTVDLCPVWQYN